MHTNVKKKKNAVSNCSHKLVSLVPYKIYHHPAQVI